MARSIDSNRNVRWFDDSASSEGVRTPAPGSTTRFPWIAHGGTPPPCSAPPARAGDGPTGINLCPSCGAPLGIPYVLLLPNGVLGTFPLGPNGGILIRRRVPGSNEWIDVEYFVPDDTRDRYLVVEPVLEPKVAAIELGVTLKTLYARAPYLASAEKCGSRWRFNRDVLLMTDLPAERARPTRREILAERAKRRRAGGCRRPGSHSWGCDGRHAGPCATSRRRQRANLEREHITRSILDDLGK